MPDVMTARLLSAMGLTLCCSLAGDVRAADQVVDIAPGETLLLQRRETTDTPIRIDGHLTEEIWQQLPAYDEFVVIDPDTLNDVPHATLVRLFYSSDGLYVGVDMEQPEETLIMRLSGRDGFFLNRDSINVTLDTSGEGRYGYWFGINLGDSLMDGIVLPERQFSNDWDGAWRGASQQTSSGWSAEFFIPWGTVAMPKVGDTNGSDARVGDADVRDANVRDADLRDADRGDRRRIGIYMSRKVAYKEERWGWPALPDTTPKFLSVLQPLQLRGVDPKQQYSIYPFSAISSDRIDDDTRYRAGADFFWRPSTNFQLTATVNPDFGSVESDQVVINLTATETFFPEKRLFFLEGQEVFVASPRADTRGRGVGMSAAPITLLNTRRIGGKPRGPLLAAGESVGKRDLIQPVDLEAAAKVTGQMGRFRYGLLGAFEDDVTFDALRSGQEINLKQDGSDYAVARLMYEDSEQGAYRAIGLLSTAVLHPARDAMAHSIDLHYLTPSGSLKVDTQAFVSDIEETETGYGGFIDFEYTFRQGLKQRVGIAYFDEHVDINDLGFLGRNDTFELRSSHIRTSSNLGWARLNQFDVRGSVRKNADDFFLGGALLFSNRIMLNNLTQFVARLSFFSEAYDDINSFGNGVFRTEERVSAALSFDSASTGRFAYGFGVGFTEEQLKGDTYTANFLVDWRPNDRVSLSVTARYQDRDGWLLHQEGANFTTFKAEQWQPALNLDYFISAQQRFRLSLQWVGVKAREKDFFLIPNRPGDLIATSKPAGPSDNFAFSQLSFQMRYRWEIAPLSDVFVVYTRTADQGRSLGNASFGDLFSDAYDTPLGNLLVVKIRYRFGS
jgi:hypothetical protein|tara:strand:- start:2140 stop:4665 length:2526 start_codon:yes stop_codon:yes gene_type:complete